jgi:hypothetical protein
MIRSSTWARLTQDPGLIPTAGERGPVLTAGSRHASALYSAIGMERVAVLVHPIRLVQAAVEVLPCWTEDGGLERVQIPTGSRRPGLRGRGLLSDGLRVLTRDNRVRRPKERNLIARR